MRDSWRVQVGGEETSALFEPSIPDSSDGLLVLAHGAGAPMDHRTMGSLASALRSSGLDVVRFNFLYMEKKSGGPDRMPKLMECYAAVVEKARSEIRPDRLFIGGHSMGGRTASMMAAEGFDCDGLILLSYPLHPAGQPEKLRDAHLASINAPVLCFNGTRDDLCTRDLMEKAVANLPNWTQRWLEGADHGYHVLKSSGRTDEDIFDEIGNAGGEWIGMVVAPRR